jgi:hypothetical protein
MLLLGLFCSFDSNKKPGLAGGVSGMRLNANLSVGNFDLILRI